MTAGLFRRLAALVDIRADGEPPERTLIPSDLIRPHLKQQIAEIERGLLKALAGLTPLGGVASFLGFGGPKADGGPVSAGTAYLVGERGPELFVPHAVGSIVPNGGGGKIINNIDARGAVDPAAVAVAVQRAVVAAVNISDARVSTRLAMLSRPSMA